MAAQDIFQLDSRSHVEQLDVILELSRNMVLMAQIKDWETLASLEESRSHKLAAFFSQPVQAGEVAAVEAVIADILAIDKQIIALSEVAYQEAADGIRQLNYAHRAALAYEQGE
ncbi:MAG: flagellar protein FliT [Gammaproteobacteria bacterium]